MFVRTAVWSLVPLASGCASDDPLDEWLVDGCWYRHDSFDFYDDDYDPPWEPFACSLPTPCEPVNTYPGEELTPERAAAIEASARCMIEGLRDGSPAVHSLSFDGGMGYDWVTYFVLPEGVVGRREEAFDLGGSTTETYRRIQEPAFFEECLAQTELDLILACLFPTHSANFVTGFFPPLDQEACIDDVPKCPDG